VLCPVVLDVLEPVPDGLKNIQGTGTSFSPELLELLRELLLGLVLLLVLELEDELEPPD